MALTCLTDSQNPCGCRCQIWVTRGSARAPGTEAPTLDLVKTARTGFDVCLPRSPWRSHPALPALGKPSWPSPASQQPKTCLSAAENLSFAFKHHDFPKSRVMADWQGVRQAAGGKLLLRPGPPLPSSPTPQMPQQSREEPKRRYQLPNSPVGAWSLEGALLWSLGRAGGGPSRALTRAGPFLQA